MRKVDLGKKDRDVARFHEEKWWITVGYYGLELIQIWKIRILLAKMRPADDKSGLGREQNCAILDQRMLGCWKQCWRMFEKKNDGNVENAFWVSGRKCRSELYGKNGDVFPSLPLWCWSLWKRLWKRPRFGFHPRTVPKKMGGSINGIWIWKSGDHLGTTWKSGVAKPFAYYEFKSSELIISWTHKVSKYIIANPLIIISWTSSPRKRVVNWHSAKNWRTTGTPPRPFGSWPQRTWTCLWRKTPLFFRRKIDENEGISWGNYPVRRIWRWIG